MNEDRLQIDIAIEDPVAFNEPWTNPARCNVTTAGWDWDVEEFICMDNVNFEAEGDP